MLTQHILLQISYHRDGFHLQQSQHFNRMACAYHCDCVGKCKNYLLQLIGQFLCIIIDNYKDISKIQMKKT